LSAGIIIYCGPNQTFVDLKKLYQNAKKNRHSISFPHQVNDGTRIVFRWCFQAFPGQQLEGHGTEHFVRPAASAFVSENNLLVSVTAISNTIEARRRRTRFSTQYDSLDDSPKYNTHTVSNKTRVALFTNALQAQVD
jgi:hypothetical protein